MVGDGQKVGNLSLEDKVTHKETPQANYHFKQTIHIGREALEAFSMIKN